MARSAGRKREVRGDPLIFTTKQKNMCQKERTPCLRRHITGCNGDGHMGLPTSIPGLWLPPTLLMNNAWTQVGTFQNVCSCLHRSSCLSSCVFTCLLHYFPWVAPQAFKMQIAQTELTTFFPSLLLLFSVFSLNK